jgi:hypothetical protein
VGSQIANRTSFYGFSTEGMWRITCDTADPPVCIYAWKPTCASFPAPCVAAAAAASAAAQTAADAAAAAAGGGLNSQAFKDAASTAATTAAANATSLLAKRADGWRIAAADGEAALHGGACRFPGHGVQHTGRAMMGSHGGCALP